MSDIRISSFHLIQDTKKKQIINLFPHELSNRKLPQQSFFFSVQIFRAFLIAINVTRQRHEKIHKKYKQRKRKIKIFDIHKFSIILHSHSQLLLEYLFHFAVSKSCVFAKGKEYSSFGFVRCQIVELPSLLHYILCLCLTFVALGFFFQLHVSCVYSAYFLSRTLKRIVYAQDGTLDYRHPFNHYQKWYEISGYLVVLLFFILFIHVFLSWVSRHMMI